MTGNMVTDIATILHLTGEALLVLIVVVAVVAFFSRHWLAEKMKSKISEQVSIGLERYKADLEKEKDDYKHSLQREMEAYKASILRDMEEHKLQVDLRRNIALKLADAKLKAYQEIEAETRDYIVKALSHRLVPFSSPEAELQERAKIIAQWDHLSNVMKVNAFFIKPDLHVKISEIQGAALALFTNPSGNLSEMRKENSAISRRIAGLSNEMQQEILGQIAPVKKE